MQKQLDVYKQLGQDLHPLVQRQIDATVAPLLARIVELESRAIKYCGVWQASQVYKAGSVVTCDGSLWTVGKDSVAERPMTPNAPWQLIVKSERTR